CPKCTRQPCWLLTVGSKSAALAAATQVRLAVLSPAPVRQTTASEVRQSLRISNVAHDVLSHGVGPSAMRPASGVAKPEVLAPAGDRDCLRAAIENGADAVYFGLTEHNARARATNFELHELPGVMDLLHNRGVKGYVALNVLIFPNELGDMERVLRGV